MDADLLRFNAKDSVTYRDSMAGGIFVAGASGSGKTSGVLTNLVARALTDRVSVVASTIKPQDTSFWTGLAASLGDQPVRVFRPGKDRFNPILYEQRSSVNLMLLVETLVRLLLLPMRRARATGNGADPFWMEATAQAIRRLISLFLMIDQPISYRLINDTMLSLPRSPEEIGTASWQERCPAFPALLAARESARSPLGHREIERAAEYLLSTVPHMPEKTLGSMIATATSPIDPLVSGLIGETLNSDDHTWTPDEVINRPGLFLIDAPIQSWGETGAVIQRMIFTSIQSAILRRPSSAAQQPVMFLMDEAQEFLDPETDPVFMRNARDRRAFMVLATQCVDNIRMACSYARDPSAAAKTIMAIPSVQIFCQTADPETRRYASELFGRTRQARVSLNTSDPQSGPRGTPGSKGRESSQGSRGASVSYDWQPDVQELDLSTLKRGGPANGWKVEALVSGPNPPWRSTGRPSLRVTFDQFRGH
jgi:type IV secretory pathway TraG/TraD family ATPase VirD4